MKLRGVERIVPPIGSFVEIDGARVHYLDRGSGSPVVLVHGLAAVMQSLTRNLVPELSRTHRVLAFDRPGAGYSIRGLRSPAAIDAQARTLAMLLDACNVRDPVVVGHSLGGAVALSFAVQFPKRAKALALIAPLTQPEQHAPPPFRGLELEPAWRRALVAYTVAPPLAIVTARRVLAEVFAPEPVPGDFGTSYGGLLGLRPRQIFNASSDMIAARDGMPSLRARYGEIATPVHVLFGREDAVLGYRLHGETLRGQIRDVHVRIVPGGHMLPVTQPAVVTEWIEECCS